MGEVEEIMMSTLRALTLMLMGIVMGVFSEKINLYSK